MDEENTLIKIVKQSPRDSKPWETLPTFFEVIPGVYMYQQAAREIADTEGWNDGKLDALLARMIAAINSGALPTRDRKTGMRCPANNPEFLFLVDVDDVNAWLKGEGVKYRWTLQAATQPQAKLMATESASDGVKAIVPDWRMQIQAEAYELWLRLRASGCNPSVYSICEDMAKWCSKSNIKGGKNQNPRAGTIRNTVLGAGHWNPPPHSVEQAKKYIAQIARTAQTQDAQTKK